MAGGKGGGAEKDGGRKEGARRCPHHRNHKGRRHRNRSRCQSSRESGVVWGKRWRAARTGACKTCRAMDGQIVALGQPFDAGGREIPEGMQAHPHCRCTVQPVTFREAVALGLAQAAPEVVSG